VIIKLRILTVSLCSQGESLQDEGKQHMTVTVTFLVDKDVLADN